MTTRQLVKPIHFVFLALVTAPAAQGADPTQPDPSLAQARADLAAQIEIDTMRELKELEIADLKAKLAKAQSDAVLSLIPDPSKFKRDPPTAPSLSATTSARTLTSLEKIADDIVEAVKKAKKVKEVKTPTACPNDELIVVTDPPRARSMLALTDDVKHTLQDTDAGLKHHIEYVKGVFKQIGVCGYVPPDRTAPSPSFQSYSSPVATTMSLAQAALSFRQILRTQYGFASSSTKESTAPMLPFLIESKLHEACYTVVVPGSLFAEREDKNEVISAANTLRNTLASARTCTENALPLVEKNAQRAAAVKQLAVAQESAASLLKTLYETKPELGRSLIDEAASGAKLHTEMTTTNPETTTANPKLVWFLHAKVLAADVDTVAREGFFSGLRLSTGAHVVVGWRIMDQQSRFVAGGLTRSSAALQDEPFHNAPKAYGAAHLN